MRLSGRLVGLVLAVAIVAPVRYANAESVDPDHQSVNIPPAASGPVVTQSIAGFDVSGIAAGWFIRRDLHLHADSRQPAHYHCLAARCSERSNRESWHGFSASVSTRPDRLLRLRLDRIVRRRPLRANHDDRSARRVGLGARSELATRVA